MRNVFWGFILIAIGLLFLLDNMGIIDFGEAVSTYWPVLLVLWGINILLKRKEHQTTHVFRDTQQKVNSELFHESSVFGDLFISIESQNFKGGSVSTIFGGNHIDLSKVSPAEGEHIMRINGVFGDVHLILPANFPCAVTGNVLFGGVQVLDRKKSGFSSDVQYVSPDFDSSKNKLKIAISQIFGNVSVSHSSPPPA